MGRAGRADAHQKAAGGTAHTSYANLHFFNKFFLAVSHIIRYTIMVFWRDASISLYGAGKNGRVHSSL
jgi:hypothetical protein